ncbi:PH domain-containing protein [Saccharopolyspora erythraea]|uniref:PH domain-containing protein n=1 Tax=Saccharopolyspora erythraea TaxID=1836 RepID=UPI001BAD4B7F|nr:PH domain-containing protein [Saccharopolyspora erythraea]QUH00430.1 PH domain-containing protein [Saccharopolyspora erythraea]
MTPADHDHSPPSHRSATPQQPTSSTQSGSPDDLTAAWHRLDARTVFVTVILVLAPLIPTLAVMLVSRASAGALLTTAGIWVAIALLLCGGAAYDWYVTSYRVTDERFELRKGVLSRSHRWIPRDRIRAVDLTSDPVHRVFRLAVVKIGTGQSSGENAELKLDAIPVHRAEALRRELLHSPQRQSTASPTAQVTDGLLAALNPAWLGYGALTVSLAAIVWGAIASAFGSFREVLVEFGVFQTILEQLERFPLWMTISGGALVALATGMLGALLLSVEMWWGFRLTREHDTTLRVRRGLLTTRSVSLEEGRLRGVEISEPLVLRWAGGARTNAVATGLSAAKDGKGTENKTLLPPAPLAEAQRVSAVVLREAEPPANGKLRAHPRVARRRRVTWALFALLPLVAALAVFAALGWIPMWTVLAVAAAGAAVAFAVGSDAYRSLGHRLGDRYLVVRRGTGVRRTVALQRDGIIGWRVRQSLFQRRSDLVTVAAITAAGSGAYKMPDVHTSDGLGVAAEAVPGLLEPFLEGRTSGN